MAAGRIILAGGSGFLGSALAADLSSRGYAVTILTRTPRPGARHREVAWDGRTAGPWTRELEGAVAIVNLTGRSVNCIHTPENKRQILESRVHSVQALGAALAPCAEPPRVWVQCASLAIYGDAGDRICDEQAPVADDFSAQVCRQWEAALEAVRAPGLRKVVLRIGLVLGPNGGALEPLAKLARRFLGGAVGSGRQYLSWMHLDDMNAMVRESLERTDFSGAYNATGPNPVTNAEFMRTLRKVVGRPWSPPAPAPLVRLGARWFMNTDADLALTGRRCIPRRLREQGFQFAYPDLEPALASLLRP